MRSRLFFLAEVVGLLVSAFCADAQQAAPQSPGALDAATPGPSQAELDSADVEPTQWLTYNKGYLGYRYSSLDEINAQNVSRLKPVCSFKLGEQGSFQSGPVVYNGVLYATSAFATFAVDAATCELRWSHRRDPGQAFRSNNKGAAVADGRIIRGFPDGHLIALDAKTGALLWERVVVDSTAGEFLTAAPLIWKGMIFLGKAGGDMGIRGEMMAFRATDGEKIWGFNTIPGPGETGSDTWQNPASIAHGGGGTWTSYSLDSAAGLLLVPVGNPGPDFASEARPGANLFTDSLVALDAATGKLRWWHQLLGPEDRDWDTSVVAAFDARDRSRLAAVAGKDGVLHVVERADGKLRFTTPLVSRYVNRTTPIPTDASVRLCPIAAVQWNGPAYSPDTNLIYMNGIDWCAQVMKGPTPEYVKGKQYLGWATPTGFGVRDPIEEAFGLINAIDPVSGRLVWRYRISAPPLASLTATAGGLVMTGDVDGELIALDAATGALIYRSNLGAGSLDGGVVTYEAKGRQFVAVAAGDNNAVYKTKGDNAIVVLALP